MLKKLKKNADAKFSYDSTSRRFSKMLENKGNIFKKFENMERMHKNMQNMWNIINKKNVSIDNLM